MDSITLQPHDQEIVKSVQNSLAKLDQNNHKGQHGRIGIIGGSAEYTGAPYFAGISALRVGCDLLHIFCAKDAAQPIKSYSPDLIVHPVLDRPDGVEEIAKWLSRLHVVVIGPGLGTDELVFNNVKQLLCCDAMKDKKIILDADGLRLTEFVMENASHLKGILTPNAMEYNRIRHVTSFGSFVVMVKAEKDIIIAGDKMIPGCEFVGSGRRCGGQGDILAGSLATLFYWAGRENLADAPVRACQGAGLLVRLCNYAAVQEKGRGALAVDMIEQIPRVFKKFFEPKLD